MKESLVDQVAIGQTDSDEEAERMALQWNQIDLNQPYVSYTITERDFENDHPQGWIRHLIRLKILDELRILSIEKLPPTVIFLAKSNRKR